MKKLVLVLGLATLFSCNKLVKETECKIEIQKLNNGVWIDSLTYYNNTNNKSYDWKIKGDQRERCTCTYMKFK